MQVKVNTHAQPRTLADTFRAAPTLLHQQQQQQQQQKQTFINKQIKLQKYCPQLAKLFEARHGVQNIKIKTMAFN